MKSLVLIVVMIFLFACTDQVSEVQRSDLSEHNMKIIPEKPSSKDEIKLVVLDDCTYHVLSGVSRDGNSIAIRKQFNGMMKWPCVAENDTILIGKLAAGTYTVNYTLVDVSVTTGDPNALAFSFQLQVSP